MAKKDSGSVKTVSNEVAEVKEEKFTFATFIYDWAGTLLIAFAVLLLAMTFFCRQITVNGDSMNNTLQSNDRLLVLNFMYTPQCGDIVVCTHGESLKEPIIKRVIAVEGQHLEIDYMNDRVIVDGEVLDETYAKGMTIRLSNSTSIPDVIPEGYVFVMGDNREDSLDSRSRRVGLIPVENIIGKAVYRIYPFEKFGAVG